MTIGSIELVTDWLFFIFFLLNTVLLLGLRDTYLIEWHIHPLIIPAFTWGLSVYLYFTFKKYFKSRCASIELVYRNESSRKIIFFGIVFLLGSVLLFGLVGYHYTNKRKLIRERHAKSISESSLNIGE